MIHMGQTMDTGIHSIQITSMAHPGVPAMGILRLIHRGECVPGVISDGTAGILSGDTTHGITGVFHPGVCIIGHITVALVLETPTLSTTITGVETTGTMVVGTALVAMAKTQKNYI